MKPSIIGLIWGIGLWVVATGAYALDLSATIAGRQSLAVNSVSVPNINSVVPDGEFSESILSGPWRILAPIRIEISIENNTPAQLITYTDHVHQSYWTRSDTDAFKAAAVASANNELNGLINVANISPTTTGLGTVPLRAWANAKNSTTESIKESDWVWVLDKSFGQKSLPILPGASSVLANNQMEIWYRMSWNAEKLPGSYTGRIFVSLSSQ